MIVPTDFSSNFLLRLFPLSFICIYFAVEHFDFTTQAWSCSGCCSTVTRLLNALRCFNSIIQLQYAFILRLNILTLQPKHSLVVAFSSFICIFLHFFHSFAFILRWNILTLQPKHGLAVAACSTVLAQQSMLCYAPF